MTKFALYNEVGEIYRLQNGSADLSEAFILTGVQYLEVPDDTILGEVYVNLDGEPTLAPKTVVEISASTLAIEANGEDECIITGLPTPCSLSVSLFGAVQNISCDEGSYTLVASTPGERVVELIGPYKSNEITVVARVKDDELDTILYNVDRTAEAVRRQLEFGNDRFQILPGQAAVKEVKYQEALTILRTIQSAGGDESAVATVLAQHSAATMPMLYAEIGTLDRNGDVMDNIYAVAQNVFAARAAFNLSMSAVENARINAKQQIRAATTFSAAMAVFNNIEWPS